MPTQNPNNPVVANDDSTGDRLSSITARTVQGFDAENGREQDELSIVGVR